MPEDRQEASHAEDFLLGLATIAHWRTHRPSADPRIGRQNVAAHVREGLLQFGADD